MAELKTLALHRILNIATECDANGNELALDLEFERYVRVPICGSTVEEE